MKYIVSTETKKATTKCTSGFSCLIGDKNCRCRVEKCINRDLHFVKSLITVSCHYQLHFGKGHICTCPIRKEIYNKYQE